MSPTTEFQANTLERYSKAALCGIAVLYVTVSIIGIRWGLPSRDIDKYLFSDGNVWPGEKMYRLANAAGRFSPESAARRGADVDVNPVRAARGPHTVDAASEKSEEPILLTGTDEDIAEIYLRYRLYTYQPDEMITMMALAGMRPGRLDLDPRLYQYGGLFIYPVGALIKLCGILGLIDVRNDVVFYLDHPDEFGKFYIVARAYAAIWGLTGVFVVFAIGRRFGGAGAGLWSALFFTLMPVVICMSHEGKPHLPGAVLMLLAVWLAMRFIDSRRARDWWLMCICCGAAVGMVLSSWPIVVLIPLIAWITRARTGNGDPTQNQGPSVLARSLLGLVVSIAVYFVTNPYVLINAFTNRDVLRSNFGNSLGMYEIARVGEGFIRVLQLTVEGATPPVVVIGLITTIAAMKRRNATIVPLLVTAAVFSLQFVMIGAGKPAEYGRFSILTNTALAIATACATGHRRKNPAITWAVSTLTVGWLVISGGAYLWNFRLDEVGVGSRIQLAKAVASADRLREDENNPIVAMLSDPAPYNCPPMDFRRARVWLQSSPREIVILKDQGGFLLRTLDDCPSNWLPDSPSSPVTRHGWITPISWANKPFATTATMFRFPG